MNKLIVTENKRKINRKILILNIIICFTFFNSFTIIIVLKKYPAFFVNKHITLDNNFRYLKISYPLSLR